MTTEAHKRTGDASAQKAYRGGRMSEYSCYYYDSEHNRYHCFDNDAEMLADELSKRMYELEQRISDVNDAALYDFAQLEERIDALEQRIKQADLDTERLVCTVDRLEAENAHLRDLLGKPQEGTIVIQPPTLADVFVEMRRNVDALKERVEHMERKLNHKGGNE